MRAAFLTLALASILALPDAAWGQGVRFDARQIQSCLDRGEGRACIGAAAEACMEATPGGYSTVGMGGCTAAEEAWWDAELNAAYQALRTRERRADTDWQPIPGMLPRPSGADTLRDVQRAWIGWRDATCQYEELQWWGGTGASLAGASCRMRLTGEQALTLRAYLADG